MEASMLKTIEPGGTMSYMPRTKPPKPADQPPEPEPVPVCSFRPTRKVYNALQRMKKKNRRNTAQMLAILVEEALAAHGEDVSEEG
jgi:hypothetical protein